MMTKKSYQILTIFQILVIIALVPAARKLESAFTSLCGIIQLPTSVVLTVILLLILSCSYAFVRLKDIKLNRHYLSVGAASLVFSLYLVQSNAELVHIFLYGPLGLFACLTIGKKFNAQLVLKAVFICVGVSLLDEFTQWLHPERYFDLQDLFLNFFASLVGIALFAATREKQSFPAKTSI